MNSPLLSYMDPGMREQAAYQGLNGLAMGLLMGGAPSTTPGGVGKGLGQGLLAFNQGYQGSLQNQLTQGLLSTQVEQAQQKAARDKKWTESVAAMTTPQPQNVQLAMAGNERPGPTAAAAARLAPTMGPLANLPPSLMPVLSDPDKGPALLAQLAMRDADPSKRYQTVNGQLVDLQATGGPRVALSVPEPIKPPPNMTFKDPNDPSKGVVMLPGALDALTGLETAKYNATLPGRLQVAQAGKPQTTVDMRGELEESKEFAKDLVKEYSDIRVQAAAAETARNQIRMARAFSDAGPDGKELPTVLQQKVGNAAVALGFNVESPAFKGVLGRVSDGQSFVGTMQNLVLTKMQAQKGPQTENDAKRIEQTVASLGNTPEARDFLMRAADALSFEDTYKREHWDHHHSTKKSFAGAAQSWSDLRKSVPFMGMSPNTNKPVFFSEFYEANRGKPAGEVIQAWKQQYGR